MNDFTTGELRAALQATVFVRLSQDTYDGESELMFPAGTIVAAQYWGAGRVVLTRFPDGATITPVAHNVKGAFLRYADDLVKVVTEHVEVVT